MHSGPQVAPTKANSHSVVKVIAELFASADLLKHAAPHIEPSQGPYRLFDVAKNDLFGTVPCNSRRC